MSTKLFVLMRLGKMRVSLLVLAVVATSFSTFATPLQASAHAITSCTSGTNCAPSLWTCTNTQPYLAWGSHHVCVASWEGFLHQYKHLYQGPMDDDFGAQMHLAVTLYQRDRGFTEDGKIGSETWTWTRLMCNEEGAAVWIKYACFTRFKYQP